jgi:hypothetical protein
MPVLATLFQTELDLSRPNAVTAEFERVSHLWFFTRSSSISGGFISRFAPVLSQADGRTLHPQKENCQKNDRQQRI